MAVQRGHRAPLHRPFDAILSESKVPRPWPTSRARRSATSPTRSRTKRVEATLGTDDSDEAVRAAVKRIDSAASKGIIHKNAAARKKSRMMKKVNASG
jgi:small subunit ribosomal protein S20